MNDEETTLAEVKSSFGEFVRERNWEQYHSPKNLAMSIGIEAAELMEIFQWLKEGESLEISGHEEKFQNVREELADIVIYCCGMANVLGIDLARSIEEKLDLNRRKYPVEKYFGKFE